ncbi:cobalamin B12-binding domain-containing protein [Candidatus Woesearchaeota archaeon]|nr:cobalamin B12-binding domain-containing protein [Candidatus Woesearchaeota archaeon]
MYAGDVHPLGTKARVLLSSVFGPYAQDDWYGSRKINPMELYHNQVTRAQGPFSIRMFHPSFGLSMIQDNISAPCTVLDFPVLERFIDEIKNNEYDIVGITSILVNIGKVKKMCREIRKYLPKAAIVLGGYLADKPDIEKLVDADYFVKGEGIRWFRNFLGEDENAPLKHPVEFMNFGLRIMGMEIKRKPKNICAALMPSLGCPVGCNFCATSAKFGGKGRFINFFETGDALFSEMRNIEKTLGNTSFFILDDNFLLHRARALRLLELMRQNNKSWTLYIFSSARVLKSYAMEQLVGLGISWVWMGLEGKDSQYAKLNGIDTKQLVKELQENGIKVLGSTIIGLENHTAENIDEVIDWAVSHDTAFHQFMLYTPLPGTALFELHSKDGSILSDQEHDIADTHGQFKFNYKHKQIRNGQETEFLLRAFRRDFEANGPSITRMIRVTLQGWQKHKNNPDARVRKRFEREAGDLKDKWAGVVWGAKRWYKNDAAMTDKLSKLLNDLYAEFGPRTRLLAPIMGLYVYRMIKKEARRLENGWAYEPKTIYRKNEQALALQQPGSRHAEAKPLPTGSTPNPAHLKLTLSQNG